MRKNHQKYRVANSLSVRAYIVAVGGDIQDGDAGDRIGMVERHLVGDAGTAIMTGDSETAVAKRPHQGHLILRHAALGIGCVVLASLRLATVAVAAQISGDYGEVPGQSRRNLAPGHMRLGVTVQKQKWRPTAANRGPDSDVRAD
jgi:hypothetical protein